MAKPNKSVFYTAAVAFTIGVAATWLVQPYFPDKLSSAEHGIESVSPIMPGFDRDFFNNFFDDDFFKRSRDPFQEMERMQKRLEEQFGRLSGPHPSGPGSLFDRSFNDWFSDQFGTSSAGSVRQEEDDKHVYYHLDLGDNNVNDAKLTVQDNYVEIFARVEQKTEDSFSQSKSVLEVHQRFPVPNGVDPNSAEVTHEKGKITIRFNKLS